MAERTTEPLKELWASADKLTSTRLLFVESASSLERARRAKRVSDADSLNAFEQLEQMWDEMVVIELGEPLMLRAALLASQFGLRGFDAVHCAAALGMDDDNVIAVSSDSRMNAAWSKLGMTVFNPHA